MIMKNLIYLLFIIPLVISCSQGVFYYTNDCNNSEGYIPINSSSQVYVRKLYLTEHKVQTGDSISTANVIDQENLLIEVQYLIFNPDKEVIYIATTPSKNIYDKSDTYLLHGKKNIYPNSFFFNTFYFGEQTAVQSKASKQIIFQDKRNVHKWNFIQTSENIINLTAIDNYRIKKVRINQEEVSQTVYVSTENTSLSANHAVEFQKINRFFYLSFKIPLNETNTKKYTSQIDLKYTIYDKDCKKTDTVSKYLLYPKAEKIFFKYSNDKLKYIFIPFSQDIKSNYHTIKFNSDRVRFMRDTIRRQRVNKNSIP